MLYFLIIAFNNFLMNQSEQTESDFLQPNQVAIQKFTQLPDLSLYEFQVSGKTPKYTNNIEGTIYKQYSQKQYLFYEFLQTIQKEDERSPLRAYIPKYFGMIVDDKISSVTSKEEKKGKEQKEGSSRDIWIDHISSRNRAKENELNKFILLKNMTFGYAVPNILDLKLGVKKSKKSNVKFEKSTTNSHHFRINGMMVALKQGEIYQECFISKYHGQKITVQDTESYLSLFFFNGELINLQLLQNIISYLSGLIIAFKKFRGVKFISSSLFIAYDGKNTNNFTINLIDFDNYEHVEIEEDQNTCFGLVNIHKFLSSVLSNYQHHLNRLKSKQLAIFKEEEVIPKQRIQKYKD